MNIHIVVEGEVGEKYLYQSWIPLVNPALEYVPDCGGPQKLDNVLSSGSQSERSFT
jgi:hypothetical protein